MDIVAVESQGESRMRQREAASLWYNVQKGMHIARKQVPEIEATNPPSDASPVVL